MKTEFVSTQQQVMVRFEAVQECHLITHQPTGKHLCINLIDGKGGEISTRLTRQEAWQLLGIISDQLQNHEEMQP